MEVKSPPQPHGYGNWLGNPLDSLRAWPRWDSWALVGLPSAWLKFRKDPLKKSRGGLSLQLELLRRGNSWRPHPLAPGYQCALELDLLSLDCH